MSKNEYDSLSEDFEKKEHELFGEDIDALKSAAPRLCYSDVKDCAEGMLSIVKQDISKAHALEMKRKQL